MPALTEALVLGKSKAVQLEDVKTLNVCGQGLDNVSILFGAPNLEVLSCSVNSLASLRHFAFTPRLQQLFLRQNAVADLGELRYLMPLKQLSTLSLVDNPVAQLEHYRAFVCAHLPQLSSLDTAPVNEHDRAAAAALRARYGLLQPATADDVLAEDLQAAGGEQQTGEQQQEQLEQQPEAVEADDARLQLQLQAALTPVAAPLQQAGKSVAAGGVSVRRGSDGAGAQLQQQAGITMTPPPPRQPSLMPAAAGTPAAAPGSRSATPPVLPMQQPPCAVFGSGSGSPMPPAMMMAPSPCCIQQHQLQQHALPAFQQPPQQQHHQASSSTNVLYAVLALMKDLDAPALRIVQREVGQLLSPRG